MSKLNLIVNIVSIFLMINTAVLANQTIEQEFKIIEKQMMKVVDDFGSHMDQQSGTEVFKKDLLSVETQMRAFDDFAKKYPKEARYKTHIDLYKSKMSEMRVLAIKFIAQSEHKPESNADCSSLKYSAVPIIEWKFEKQSGSEGNPESAAKALVLYNKACVQAKCLMNRDKLNFKDFSKKITATGTTPIMKKMKADAIKEMDLETCSQ